MNDWFNWNGVSSTAYGIHVTEQPPITVPSERVTFTDVPGLSGSLSTLEGDDVYDDITLTVECNIADPVLITAIAAWLRGSGTVSFANRPGGFYYARIVNQIPFEKILRGNPHRTFAVNFRCKPFFYHDDINHANRITITSSTASFTNPGSIASRPLITVTGSGEASIQLNGSIIELDFTGTGGALILNSEIEECYYASSSTNVSANSNMSGEFFKIPSGANAFAWTGSITRVVIDPNWRSL